MIIPSEVTAQSTVTGVMIVNERTSIPVNSPPPTS